MVLKRRPTHPRILPDVLQAIVDLRDMKGSTVRKITQQVQTAMRIYKLHSIPRNIVTQVKKALQHGVVSGVLKRTTGKYKLTFVGDMLGSRYITDGHVQGGKYKTYSNRNRGRKKRAPPRMGQRQQSSKRKKQKAKRGKTSTRGVSPEDLSSSEDIDSRNDKQPGSGDSVSESSATSTVHCDDSADMQIPDTRAKRSVWNVSKHKTVGKYTEHGKRPRGIGQGGGQKVRKPNKIQKKKISAPADSNRNNPSEERNAIDEESQKMNENEARTPAQNAEEYQQELVPYIDYNQDRDIGDTECDNPESLRSFKQELDEDSASER